MLYVYCCLVCVMTLHLFMINGLLYVLCCGVMFVARCLLYVGCGLSCVVVCLLRVVRGILFVVCCVVVVGYWLLCVV